MDQSNSPQTDSILQPLRQAQLSAKEREDEVLTAFLSPQEFLILHRELVEEGRDLTAAEASALAYFVAETKVEVEFDDDKVRQLFRAAFIIHNSYGQVCAEFELCKHDSCRASVGAWQTASEALDAWR